MVTTNFPDGVTNAVLYSALAEFVASDPTRVFQFFDDFIAFRGGSNQDWLVTNASAGTLVLADENGGVLVVTNGAADNNFISAQWQGFNTANVSEQFKLIAGKKTWFKSRFKVSDATQTDFAVGLISTNTSPIAAVVDGLYFLKPDDDTELQLKVVQDSTATTFSVGDLVTDTYATAGFVYNGVDAIEVYLNDVLIGHAAVTNLPDDEELAITFAVQNGSAGAKSASIDYIFAASER